jgi:hypothetical protein
MQQPFLVILGAIVVPSGLYFARRTNREIKNKQRKETERNV